MAGRIKRGGSARKAGPYAVKGKLGGRLASVDERLYYDEGRNLYVLEDGTLFDAKASETVRAKASARAAKRAELLDKLVTASQKAETLKAKYDETASRTKRAEIKEEIAKVAQEIKQTQVDLEKSKTPTQRFEEAGKTVVTKESGTAGARKGILNVLMEYDKRTDKVRFFFPGSHLDKANHPRDCPPALKQCYMVAPAVRSALSKYIEFGTGNSGEYGYFAIPSWDFPAALKDLSRIPNVRLRGTPELDLAKEFKTLDAKAKAIDTRTIEFGEAKPRVGTLRDGTKTDFQLEGIKFLMSRDHAILADDMGLGKTYQGIIAAHNAVPKSQQILVICPAAMVGSWVTDIKAFMPSAPVVAYDSKYHAANGAITPRPEKARFVIVSYQGASNMEGKSSISRPLLARTWGLVIVDEAHRLKHQETLIHKFVERLKADRMWFMTGTPIANRVTDFYGLLKLARHPAGKRLDEFKLQYVPSTLKMDRLEVAEDRDRLIALGKALTGFVLRRTKEEVLKNDLPVKVGGLGTNVGFINATLPDKVASDLAKDGVPAQRVRHKIALAKVPATWEVASRVLDAGDKVVLFTTYTDVLDAFAELCDRAKILHVRISGGENSIGKSAQVKLFQGTPLEDKEEKWVKKNLGQWYLNLVRYVPLEEWSKEDVAICKSKFGSDPKKWPHKIQAVLAQMVAASEGVTLTQADTLLFNDLDYMPSRHQQAEDRIYRLSKGGKLPHPAVYIGYIYVDDPRGLEQRTMKALLAKMQETNTVYENIGKDHAIAAARVRKGYLADLAQAEQARKSMARVRNPSSGM